MFSPEQLSVIKYCTEECIRQQSGMASVYNMINAWDHADWQRDENDKPKRIDSEFVQRIGMLVEPEENSGGFRTHKIGITDPNAPFGVRDIGSDWKEIRRHIETLLASYYESGIGKIDAKTNGWHEMSVTPEDQFYLLFEGIHPFGDGNGRTGKILYNYLLDSMDNPKMPPNFWDISNP